MTLNANEALKPYGNMLKGWPKQAGSKPTGEMLATAHALNARPGKQALAMALALRPEGVTGAQIVLACGAPQLNKMRDTVAKGWAKFAPLPMTDAGHKVYHLELTAKGTTKVANATDKAPEAKATKKAKASKPRKAKVKAPVTEAPAPVIQAEAPAPEATAH